MSIQFNDITTYKGLVQIFEKEIGVERGTISENTDRLKEFTVEANLALDDYWNIAIPASGKWQLDDSNHTDFPFIRTNIVAGQSDYLLSTDGSSNIILDVYRVFILPSATATQYVEIKPTDVQTQGNDSNYTAGNSTTGVPTEYDKTGNGIIFTTSPSYSATNGLKVFINREASYFQYTDTTKKAGVRGTHHKYFALKPALEIARRNSLANVDRLERQVMLLERQIQRDFGKRSRDEAPVMRGKKILFI